MKFVTEREDRITLLGLTSFVVWTFLTLPFLYSVQAEAAGQHGEEFWPPIWGYNLKVTDTLIAAFTAGLFIATWLLYRATAKLVRGADQTAERQLRAYVFASAHPIAKNNNQWQCKIEIRNSGQTPAYSVVHTTLVGMVEEPSPEGIFNIQLEPGSRSSIAPGACVITTINETLSPLQIAQIQAGTHGFYIFGEIRYRDAFDKPRYTKFRYMHNQAAINTNSMVSAFAGNEES